MIPEKILHSSAEKVKQMLKNNLLLMMENLKIINVQWYSKQIHEIWKIIKREKKEYPMRS